MFSMEQSKSDFKEILINQGLIDEAQMLSKVDNKEQLMELLDELEEKIDSGTIQLDYLNGKLVSEKTPTVKSLRSGKYYSLFYDFRKI